MTWTRKMLYAMWALILEHTELATAPEISPQCRKESRVLLARLRKAESYLLGRSHRGVVGTTEPEGLTP